MWPCNYNFEIDPVPLKQFWTVWLINWIASIWEYITTKTKQNKSRCIRDEIYCNICDNMKQRNFVWLIFMRNCLFWKCTKFCDLCHSLAQVTVCPSPSDNNKLISMLLCCDLSTRNVPVILINSYHQVHFTYCWSHDNKPHTHTNIHPHIYSGLCVILVSLKCYQWCWRMHEHCLYLRDFWKGIAITVLLHASI